MYSFDKVKLQIQMFTQEELLLTNVFEIRC